MAILYTESRAEDPTIELTPSELSWLKKHPVIRVNNEVLPPFNFSEDGEERGFSIDYMNLIAGKIGVKVEYVRGPTWDEFLMQIREKKIDVILNIVETKDRDEFIEFTYPYFVNSSVLVVNSGSLKVSTLDELNGKIIAIPKSFFYEDIVRQRYPRVNVVTPDSQLECLKLVNNGEADATIGDFAVQNYLISKHKLGNARIVEEPVPLEVIFDELRIGVRDDWPELVGIINKTIAVIAAEKKDVALHTQWHLTPKDQSNHWYWILVVVISALLFALICKIASVSRKAPDSQAGVYAHEIAEAKAESDGQPSVNPKDVETHPHPTKRKERVTHDLACLRQILVDKFDEEGLKNICFDNFQSLHNLLGSSASHGKRARRMIEYANQQSEIEKLLEAMKDTNLSAYEMYLQYIGKVGQIDATQGTATVIEEEIHELSPERKLPSSCDLLVVTANPKETTKLQLRKEADSIRNAIALGKPGQTVVVHAELSSSINDLRRSLIKYSPRIVHFAGHGDDAGNLLFESDQGQEQRVRPEDLADLFREFPSIETVMLNACYSSDAAEELAEHVKCVVGMGNKIDEESAREFALAFYEGLAVGKDYTAAFLLGRNAIRLNRLPDADVPMAFFPGMETDNANSLRQTSSLTTRTHRAASATSSAVEDESESKVVSVKLWYGTIREPKNEEKPQVGYGNKRDNKINYGTCEVSVPRRRSVGSLGSWAWHRWLTWNDDRVTLDNESISPMEVTSFWRSLQCAVANLEEGHKHALVFVHGYNVSFKDAARRTAQIAVDLPLDGPASFFSWPSLGHLMGYCADEATIKYAKEYLIEYLTTFVEQSGADRIHLVAHSMGNRGLLHAIEDVVQRVNCEKPFDQIFLAAPDVDVDVFGQKARVFKSAAKQVTLYASRSDRAVWASSLVHIHDRVGYHTSKKPPQLFNSIDTVLIKTSFDLFDLGHGYVASEDGLLNDMNQAIRHGASPRDRRLTEKRHRGETYWELDAD